MENINNSFKKTFVRIFKKNGFFKTSKVASKVTSKVNLAGEETRLSGDDWVNIRPREKKHCNQSNRSRWQV